MTSQNRVIQGIPASPGIVLGRAKVLAEKVEAQPYYCLLYAPEEIDEELSRFLKAVEQAEVDLIALKESLSPEYQDHAHLLDLQILMLKERMIFEETQRLIREERYNAEWALFQAWQKVMDLFKGIGDPYIKGRIQDVEEVYRRLQTILAGKEALSLSSQEPVIVVARDLSPAEATQMTRSQVLGFITERGGRTSHTAIIAQSLEIPAVVGVDFATREITSGETVILDGLKGQIILDPDEAVSHSYQERQKEFEAFKEEVAQSSGLAAITIDEYPTKVLANIELPEEVELGLKYGADGVGLYRTEFLYLRLRHLPTEKELFEDYRRVVEAMAPKVVTIRTLDIGGDKFLSPLEYAPEMNPALGLRAIRFCLKETNIFRTQLKAILRASAYGQVRVMFPLISNVGEIKEARRLLEEVKQDLEREGLPFDSRMPVGAMIEVPAAVTLAHLLAQYADFFSIGTNDLIQYALAIDRVNKQVADMYQPLHPAVIRMIREVVHAARVARIPVAMCGEMAGDPLYIPVLLGLGVAELSMNAVAIPVAKHVIRMITIEAARKIARHALRLITVKEINDFVAQEMNRRFPGIFRFGRTLAANHEL
ncbi:MAG: phosphoenolpyruvate--protein phosphotransferase [Syntrophales bacterium]|nr:phosphoenolpyruvate--protein phosphotransferase [Syntrophales bacterium]MDD5642944.1 phosphoenolpyruvate--protein phosphotransferase [Syntrophales bacterium]